MARRALGPATLTLVQAVEAALVEEDRSLLVACSGGPDSLALAQSVVHVGRRRRLPIAAAIVDHGLQPSSADQAAATAATLTALGYADVTVRTVTVAPTGAGPEADARAARHRALDELAASRHATVLLGHTRDDQTEQACRENDLVPWRDPHNTDPSFARVRVRQTVLPALEAELGPGISEALARTAALSRDDADLLDVLAAEADPGTARLDCDVMKGLPPALRRRVIARWLRLEHGLGDLSAGHLHAVEALLTDWHGQQGVDVPGGVRVRRLEGRLELGRSGD